MGNETPAPIDPSKDFLDDDLLGMAQRIANNAIQTAEILNPALVGYGHHWREHIITEAHYMLRTAVMHERQRAGRDHSGIFPTHFNERK